MIDDSIDPVIEKIIKDLPPLETQAQYGTNQQLEFLIRIAAKLKLYDAHDVLQTILTRRQIPPSIMSPGINTPSIGTPLYSGSDIESLRQNLVGVYDESSKKGRSIPYKPILREIQGVSTHEELLNRVTVCHRILFQTRTRDLATYINHKDWSIATIAAWRLMKGL